MTHQEKIVVSACTGIVLVDDFTEVHRYIQAILGRPVLLHELASEEVWKEIREKTKPDLLWLARQ